MMVTLIEIAVKNRLKWIVILLLYHEIIFYVSTFCVVTQLLFPFSIVSMLLRIHASHFPSMLLRMLASPLLPFNALEDALPPAFKSLDACLPPPIHSDSETHLTTCCKSHFLLIRFCFIYFDFLIITTMRRNYSLVSHVLFISQHCSPI